MFFRWLDLNHGPLEFVATALPTEPQPLPDILTQSSLFCKLGEISLTYSSMWGVVQERPTKKLSVRIFKEKIFCAFLSRSFQATTFEEKMENHSGASVSNTQFACVWLVSITHTICSLLIGQKHNHVTRRRFVVSEWITRYKEKILSASICRHCVISFWFSLKKRKAMLQNLFSNPQLPLW